jgi:hypothetical protein
MNRLFLVIGASVAILPLSMQSVLSQDSGKITISNATAAPLHFTIGRDNMQLAPGASMTNSCTEPQQISIITAGRPIKQSLPCGNTYALIYNAQEQAYDIANQSTFTGGQTGFGANVEQSPIQQQLENQLNAAKARAGRY